MDETYASARRNMVENQLRDRGIRDERLLDVFMRVPRHEFVSPEYAHRAYADSPLPIGEGQTISQPYMVAVMTQVAHIEPGERVLELGTGSGYQTAILLELGAEVFTVERVAPLLERARSRLERLGYTGWQAKVGDGTLGWPEEAPFDAIVVTAGAPGVPQPLLDQLALHGRLVIPVEEHASQVLYIVTKTEQGFVRRRGERCTFVPLIGEFGWHNDPRE